MSRFSVSRLAIAALRSVRQIWPFEIGKDLPNRFGGLASKAGLLKPVWFEFESGLWMKLNMQELIHETILLEGLWDPQLTQLVKNRLDRGMVFIDIGAHSGYFTLLAARNVAESGRVLAVEPNPKIANQLRENLNASNIHNTTIEQIACNEHGGAAVLYVHDDSNSSASSLSEVNVHSGNQIAVQCQPLDEVVERHALNRVDLIKIDVEGAELSVIRGALSTLSRFKPTIVMELDSTLLAAFGSSIDDVRNELTKLNYTVKPLGGHSNYVCEQLLS
jgi:FkbM family methyltransferase